ncbi:lipopolysaccharide biosynthesis protein [Agromyces aerolatus]|uniref:lipopolysaccharide biosynthesis protein n=1 Tax=Agromyces sp. LY-1074 TaxID=3074080 RepID=UPI0028575F14|nr:MULTISPECIES: lipopolysaccharide biosynthesis protein [unclassified Agromyces]MDR5701482.1 lipopolysaccharide biosynthesis protein [Agromyces sp. LY-1074]MDR5704451.1 lipopolysaccharide biosynthesis protein [Agromyces sp. LY-1358]
MVSVSAAGRSGGRITLVGQAARLTLSLVSVALLSRLLDPADFGLLAMVTAFVGVGDIIRDLGLSAAAVQARTISQFQKSNLFWVNLGVGASFALICIAAAPALADLYGSPELTGIASSLAIVYLLNGLQTQSQAELTRSLRFATLTFTDLVSFVSGVLVAVLAALAGFGYWALVWQLITQAIVLCAGRLVAAGWIPSMPRRNQEMGNLLRFGRDFTLVQLVAYAGNNAQSVIIGPALGATALGIYTRAYQLYMVPTFQILGPLTSVAHATLSRLQDDDEAFNRAVRQTSVLLGYPLALACALVVAMPDQIVAVLLGPGWGEAASVLSILSVGGAILGLNRVLTWVYQARGLVRAQLRYMIFSRSLIIAAMIAGLTGGISGVALAFTAGTVLAWPLNAFILSRTGFATREYWTISFRVLLVSSVVAAAAWATAIVSADLPAFVQLLLSIPSSAVVIGVLLLIRPIRADLSFLARALVRRRG